MILQMSNIDMTYRSGDVATKALDNVSIDIEEGEFLALMGPSGCGKSTLMNVAGLLLKPADGAVVYQGKDLAKASSKARAAFRRDNIGFIFQGFNLIDDMSVLDNVALPLKYRGIDKSHREQMALDALDRVGIAFRANHKPSRLSGGQQQRAAIARAIAGAPALLLADEPTGNLDSGTGILIMDLLKDLNVKGSTLIMVTHSERDSAYARRIVRLLDGRVEGPRQVAL